MSVKCHKQTLPSYSMTSLARSLAPVAVCERMLLGNSRVTLVGLIIAIFGVAFMFGGHPVIAAMLLLLAWVLVMLDEDMKSG
ncbi:hypothetical protein SAMN05444169_5916 [Bradyrhizobium erythrophlei]|jgi:hypothetical protein|uniref:Uncharacterized protein n=1 Tax=Bradyrhizobium erythrophlei TaxID=1437360 RepID=A0A1M5QG60_9BRAD|nr:hypothetical protein SAMN05444169_5916 [Bradyrhizobium erythrophlei]